MKKSFIFSTLLCVGLLFSAAAKEKADYKYEYQEAAVTYHNVQIYKILDHRDAFLVMYAKGHRDVGNITIPKKWYNENPSKLSFRQLPKGVFGKSKISL